MFLTPETLTIGDRLEGKILRQRNPVIQSKAGDLPEGWYFYDAIAELGRFPKNELPTGYIVFSDGVKKMEEGLAKPLISLKEGPKFYNVTDLSGHTWNHKSDFKYRLVWNLDIQAWDILNWHLFPDALLGEFW